MGDKSEAKIIAGIEALGRRSNRIPIGRAWPFAQELMAYLREAEGVKAVELGGSLRRMRVDRRRHRRPSGGEGLAGGDGRIRDA